MGKPLCVCTQAFKIAVKKFIQSQCERKQFSTIRTYKKCLSGEIVQVWKVFFLRSGKGADLFKGFKVGFMYNLDFCASYA